jgi:hypothetical protein
VAKWRLTVRHGPRVSKEGFDELGDALDAMRDRAVAIATEGRLGSAQGFRPYEPSERVAARIEISTGGLFRGREAGVDVMGDGTLVPYRGIVRKEKLEGGTPNAALDAVRQALS